MESQGVILKLKSNCLKISHRKCFQRVKIFKDTYGYNVFLEHHNTFREFPFTFAFNSSFKHLHVQQTYFKIQKDRLTEIVFTAN